MCSRASRIGPASRSARGLVQALPTSYCKQFIAKVGAKPVNGRAARRRRQVTFGHHSVELDGQI